MVTERGTAVTIGKKCAGDPDNQRRKEERLSATHDNITLRKAMGEFSQNCLMNNNSLETICSTNFEFKQIPITIKQEKISHNTPVVTSMSGDVFTGEFSRSEDIILEDKQEEDRFIISTGYLGMICTRNTTNLNMTTNYQAMIDSGANVNLAPRSLAKKLGLPIIPHTDGRKIGTADFFF